MPAAGLVIAAPASGSGKTTVTLALIAALRARGLRVAAAKAGPDHIDPAFHTAAAGRDCLTLDPWAMRPATLAALAGRVAAESDILIVEGAMGLFDGAVGGGGATADLAAAAGWPVVLVIDAKGQGASVAALARGFRDHRDDVALAAVIGNRVGSAAHGAALREALARIGMPLLGCLPARDDLRLPSRHLGLVQAREHGDLDGLIARAAGWAAAHLDLDALLALARPARWGAGAPPDLQPPGQRIALARDDAFAFAYPHLLAAWHAGGAEIVPFSPLAGEGPEAAADAVFLPGGYPELHAGRLATARRFLDGLAAAARRGATIYGECGGYMVLGETLTDAQGATHAMAGLLPLATSFAERRLHLGYREATLIAGGWLGAAGARWRGHEFHYATVVGEEADAPAFALSDAAGAPRGLAGCRRGSVLGSFLHLIDRA
jgi:cobyrinic acid a,c-diamide synthase